MIAPNHDVGVYTVDPVEYCVLANCRSTSKTKAVNLVQEINPSKVCVSVVLEQSYTVPLCS